MNPAIAILMALISKMEPKDVAKILAALAIVLDPLIAKRGPIVRAAWSILKTILATEAFAGDLKVASQSFFAANPQIAAEAGIAIE